MSKFVIALLMVTTMLHWPNMILHYNDFIVGYIKPTFIIGSIFLFGWLGRAKISPFASYFVLMLAVCTCYSWVNGVYYNAYMLRTIFFVSMCAFFYRHPIFVRRYLKIGICVSSLLGLQAFVLTAFMLGGFSISYDTVAFVDGGERDFNWLAGFRNDPSYFRVISYFTETNRLAYFLTPSLFVCYAFAKESLYFKFAFFFILFGVVSTFSVFSFFAILVGWSFFMVLVRRRGIRYFFSAPIFGLLIIGIYFLSPEYFSTIFDKSGSIAYRFLGIIYKIEMIVNSPFGVGELALAKSLALTPEANSTITLLYWGIVGGMQSVILLLILLVSWLLSILKLAFVRNDYAGLLACGMLASIMQQSFYGTYFEYYFLSMMALVIASVRNRKALLSSERMDGLNAASTG